jgi:exopolysaccharide biosynthesis polyprenyl glycosylphosphotransferase
MNAVARPRRQRVGMFSRRYRLISVYKISDLVGMALAFGMAALLAALESNEPSLIDSLSIRLKLLNFAVLIGLLACWHACFLALGLYDAERACSSSRRLVQAAKAASLGVLVLCGAAVAFDIVIVTPLFVTALWVCAVEFVCSLRIGLKWALDLAGGHALLRRQALVAGTGPRALALARQLEADPESDVQVVGFVDDDWPGMAAFRHPDRLVVADLKNLASFVRDHVVDEIVIALPLDVMNKCRRELFTVCREYGITMRFPVSALAGLDPERDAEPDARDHIIFSLYHGAIGGWPLFSKRVFDLMLAVPLFLASLPIFVGTALLIKATSPGPIFFTQQRVGFNKRRFTLYKFRTMEVGAEAKLNELEHLNESQGPTFKITNDPRVTRLGKLLRSTSIDELPQLINVIKGEMSLVGPRPLPLRDVERFEEDRHRKRFSVLPGLTGLWQVSGRSSVSFDRWIDLDLEYIDQWSLGLDLKILMRTIPAVLLRDGAH